MQAFGGFAQMLDSTFYATQSSFMAMIGVAEQFGHVRNYLGQIFSVMSVYPTIKRVFNRLRGKVDPGDMAREFSGLNGNSGNSPSAKPLLIFISMVVGLPWLFSKLMRLSPQVVDTNVAPNTNIKDLDFCKAIHDFSSDTPGDISLKKGDIVAILSRTDAKGVSSAWWNGRTQEGRVGIFPSNFVQVLPRRRLDKPAEQPWSTQLEKPADMANKKLMEKQTVASNCSNGESTESNSNTFFLQCLLPESGACI